MANGKQIGKRINYLSVETLPDWRVIGHIFSYRSQYPSRTDQYVVLTAARLGQQSDNTHPRWQLCAMGPVGHLKGHHAYAYLGLQAPHGQIQLDTTNHIRCNMIIIPSDSVDQDGQCASIQSYIQIQESRGGCHEQKMDNERAETRGNMTGLRYYRRT